MAALALVFDLIARDGATAGFNRAAAAADRLAGSAGKATAAVAGARTQASVAAAGKKMTQAFTLPLLAAAAVSIKSAADFEQATNVYVTAAGESVKNLGKIRDGIKSIAQGTGTSIKNLTDAEYLVEKAGLRGAGGLKVLDAAAKGAREENAQLSDVVQAMTSVMASYHLGTDKSVQVMNALKTGAGQAKVSMEDFSRALSTVIPIASANKISIQQVFGAYATLTQHGTSANEATQELAATIRNLAAPNRVAQNQMQQLGLSVVDVTKNIGKRGLTGTIDLLVGAITSHMGKAGLVLQNAFNQSKSAAEDAQITLSKLPPAAAKVAKAYSDGSISLGDYRAALKKLPADQANLVQQFKAVEDRAKGFNTLLKNGDPAAQTFTSALKKMAGGAIGLNTILQLSGENTTGLNSRVKAVSESLHNGAKDVEGWASTQKLASVQADRLMQSIHVLAIDLGTQLLPVFQKIVSGIQGAVGWFKSLSSTQKLVLAWSVGVVAAMGPVLSLGAKLIGVGNAFARFSTFMVAQAARFSTGLALNATAVSAAMGRIGAAIGGAAIGAAVGTLTANSSNAVKAIGVLGSAAAGAAIGFGAGGPLGAAIGGVAGGLTALATQFFGAGHAAKAAVQATDDYTDAILRDNDALGKNTRALVINTLQKNGLYDAALKVGISQKTLTDAALGNTSALTDVNNAQLKVLATQLLAGQSGTKLTKVQQDQLAASMKLRSGLGDVAAILAVNKHAADNEAAASGKAAKATKSHGAAAAITAKQLTGAGIAAVTAGGVLTGLGKIKAYPQFKVLGLDEGLAKLFAFQRAEGLLKDKTVHINVIGAGSATTKGASAAGSRSWTPDGKLPPGWSTVGEKGWELAKTDMNGRTEIFSHEQSRHMTNLPARLPGFANGTTSNPRSIYRVDGGYGFQGQYFGGKDAYKEAKGALADFVHNLHAAAKYISPDALSNARSGIRSGLSGVLSAARSGSRSDATSAFAALRTSGNFGKQLDNNRKSLLAAVSAYGKATDTLTKANQTLADAKAAQLQDYATFKSAVSGSFDITSAGQNADGRVTGLGIFAAAKQAVARARAWVGGIRKLANLNIFPSSYLRSLLEQGPAGLETVQALLGLGTSGLKKLAAQERALTGYGVQAGQIGGIRLDQGAVNRAAGNQEQAAKDRVKAQAHLHNELVNLTDRIDNALKHLKIEADGKVLARVVNTENNKSKART